MTDRDVHEALCSKDQLVVVEAPAGCGKTFQGAKCAQILGARMGGGRVLVLTHTHAASDVFCERVTLGRAQVEIKTIDSLIGEIANRYHESLGIPSDSSVWARGTTNGYSRLASKVGTLVTGNTMIGAALARRYPLVICDEHQDASKAQEAVIRAMIRGGAKARVLGDPMQGIYRSEEAPSHSDRWDALVADADQSVGLSTPHRWSGGAEALGQWILDARKTLRSGGQLDLSDPPQRVKVIRADNRAPGYGGFRLETSEARPIWSILDAGQPLLMLAAHNRTVESVRAFFARRLPIWEGHTRESLDKLVQATISAELSAPEVCRALVRFMGNVATGFSASEFGNRLIQEVEQGCSRPTRGKPAALQAIGRKIIEHPDQIGVAAALLQIREDSAFAGVRINYPREFRDAILLGEFADSNEGLAALAHRRAYARAPIPDRTISTVHKAKGLECENVLIVPCDDRHFGDNEGARCLLYVAISRATSSLTLVVPRDNPSPLVALG